jgi:hypothetical protein
VRSPFSWHEGSNVEVRTPVTGEARLGPQKVNAAQPRSTIPGGRIDHPTQEIEMKSGPRIATAVAIGYALGRSRRMKLAIMVGGMLAGQRVGNPKELLAKASTAVSSSPELSELGNTLRSRLTDAARTAAVAAASNKIDDIGDSLSERAAKIRSPESDSPPEDGADDEEPERSQADPEDDREQGRNPPDDSVKPSRTRTRPRKPDTSRAGQGGRGSSAKQRKADSSASGSTTSRTRARVASSDSGEDDA